MLAPSHRCETCERGRLKLYYNSVTALLLVAGPGRLRKKKKWRGWVGAADWVSWTGAGETREDSFRRTQIIHFYMISWLRAREGAQGWQWVWGKVNLFLVSDMIRVRTHGLVIAAWIFVLSSFDVVVFLSFSGWFINIILIIAFGYPVVNDVCPRIVHRGSGCFSIFRFFIFFFCMDKIR